MQAVILAAGEGKRVRPLTWSRPKAMIPVANRPIIEYAIDALVKNGIRDIIVVVGYRKEQVIRFLNNLELPIEVVIQEKQLGTADALRQAKSKITGDFLVLPGDNYIDPQSIARISEVKDAILVKEHPKPSNFGVVEVRDGNVESIVEKPEHTTGVIVSTGIYSLSKDFFRYLGTNNSMTEVVTCMLDEKRPLKAVVADDWQDAIYPWDLLKMNERLLRTLPAQREGTVSRQTIITGTVKIGKGTTLGPNTTITGPVIIGEDCTIGPNCCILPNTSIGSRVVIEPLTCVGNSIILDDSTIGSHSRITETVIGERCEISDHASVQTRSGILEIEETAIRSRFGSILGDNVKAGPFTMFGNCIVGNNATIEGNRDITSRIVTDNALVI